MKNKYKVVEAEWIKEVEYNLYFSCPYCNKMIDDYELGIDEGEYVNKICICPNCKEKFKLFVEEI